MKKNRLSVVGAGYVGLCTAVGFASRGYSVIVTDVDEEKIAKISAGIPPFHEPGLNILLVDALGKGLLECKTKQTEEAVVNSDISFVSVGTPSKPDGSVDLQFVESASREVGRGLGRKDAYHLVVVKSTVVPGTTQGLVKPILEDESGRECGSDFGLCMNPEFLRQGSAFEDTVNADRVVIGENDRKSGDLLESFFREFYGTHLPTTFRTSLATAELIKYASNSFLATKISFVNTIANMCEKISGADVKVVSAAMGMDRRIGPFFLDAGLGYGGSCLPKDVKALVAHSRSLGYEPNLLESVEEVNNDQPIRAVILAKELLGSLKGKNIAILGLSFKPDTDDMREARVIPIVSKLLGEGVTIAAYDPVAMPVAKKIFKDKIRYTESAKDCLKGADCCLIVTEWKEFRTLKQEDFVNNMRQPILIDGRRIYDPKKFSQMKFRAIGLGL